MKHLSPMMAKLRTAELTSGLWFILVFECADPMRRPWPDDAVAVACAFICWMLSIYPLFVCVFRALLMTFRWGSVAMIKMITEEPRRQVEFPLVVCGDAMHWPSGNSDKLAVTLLLSIKLPLLTYWLEKMLEAKLGMKFQVEEFPLYIPYCWYDTKYRCFRHLYSCKFI